MLILQYIFSHCFFFQTLQVFEWDRHFKCLKNKEIQKSSTECVYANKKYTLNTDGRHTFGHPLQQAEDGASPYEFSGLEEVYSRRKGPCLTLPLFHFEQHSIQLLLSISELQLTTCLHGCLKFYEHLSLPGVRDGLHTNPVK